MKRALLYRRGGLGDTLLTFPLLEVLKSKGYHVTAVGNTDYFELALKAGWADKILPEIPTGDFDLKLIIGVDGNIKTFPSERMWIVEHYLREAGFWGVNYSKTLPLIKRSENIPSKTVILHPSSGSRFKNLEPSLFLEIEEFLKERGFDVLYPLGEADRWLKEYVKDSVPIARPVDFLAVAQNSALFVGSDSGFAHLSAYLGVPTVVIYGPSDPIVWRPIGERVFALVPDLECAPCFPDVCGEMTCLLKESLLQSLLPLLDHILVNVNEDNPFNFAGFEGFNLLYHSPRRNALRDPSDTRSHSREGD